MTMSRRALFAICICELTSTLLFLIFGIIGGVVDNPVSGGSLPFPTWMRIIFAFYKSFVYESKPLLVEILLEAAFLLLLNMSLCWGVWKKSLRWCLVWLLLYVYSTLLIINYGFNLILILDDWAVGGACVTPILIYSIYRVVAIRFVAKSILDGTIMNIQVGPLRKKAKEIKQTASPTETVTVTETSSADNTDPDLPEASSEQTAATTESQ